MNNVFNGTKCFTVIRMTSNDVISPVLNGKNPTFFKYTRLWQILVISLLYQTQKKRCVLNSKLYAMLWFYSSIVCESGALVRTRRTYSDPVKYLASSLTTYGWVWDGVVDFLLPLWAAESEQYTLVNLTRFLWIYTLFLIPKSQLAHYLQLNMEWCGGFSPLSLHCLEQMIQN